MDGQSKVSICMRNYNYGHFVGEAIQSVLDQTHRNFELIIVDDCSTDNSEAVVKSFADRRIKFYQNENRLGNVANLNKCLSLASGDYMAILDSDDMFIPTSLEKRVSVMDSNPAVGLVYSSSEIIDSDEGVVGQVCPFAEDHVASGDEEFRALVVRAYVFWPTVMLRRRVYETLGGFDEGIAFSSGWEMWLRIALNYDIAYIAEALLLKRDHPENLSHYYWQTNQVGMEEYKIVKKVFANLPQGKEHLSALEPQALRGIARVMQRRAFSNLTEGQSRLARKNLGLAIAIDDSLIGDWKTHILFFATFFGRSATLLEKLPPSLICRLAGFERTPSFFSAG